MQSTSNVYILKKPDETLSWTVTSADGASVGRVWLETEETEFLEAPSAHLSMNAGEPQEEDIKKTSLDDVIKYAYRNLPYQNLYSRYETDQSQDEKLYKSLGFDVDGKAYVDDDGRKWQNVKLVL